MTDEEARGRLRDLVEFDERGRAIICFGALLTIYFRDGYRADVRSAVLDCFNEYHVAFGNALRWWVTEGGHFGPVSALLNRDMSRYLLSVKFDTPDSELNWAFLWHGGKAKEDASPFRIYGFGASRADCEQLDALSFLSAMVPVPVTLEEAHQLEEFACTWADRLKAQHGYGGVSVIASPDDGLAAKSEGRIVYYGRRFPGLEVDYPLSHALFTKQGIKGVNWITMLSTALAAKVGGRDALRSRLSDIVRVRDVSDGVVIIAGQMPAIGDTYEHVETPLYQQLHRVLEPVRISTHPAVRRSRDGFDRLGFEAWLNRFETAP